MAKKKEINVSEVPLVEKDGLLEELTQKLTEGINDAFERAFERASTDLSDMVKEKVSGESKSSDSPLIPRISKSKSAPIRISSSGGRTKKLEEMSPREQFDAMLKHEQKIGLMVDRLSSIQKKQHKDTQKEARKGKVYSNVGLRHGDELDEKYDILHELDQDQLKKLFSELDRLKETLKHTTVGEEQKILTQQTLKLQQAITQESQNRKTVMGKLGHWMDKQNIDAVSIVAAMTGGSPLIGFLTKFVLDKHREHKDESRKKQVDSHKLKDTLIKQLPRGGNEDANLTPLSNKEIINFLSDKDEHFRHDVLEELKKRNVTGDQQHAELREKLVHPDYVPRGNVTSAVATPPPIRENTSPVQVPVTNNLFPPEIPKVEPVQMGPTPLKVQQGVYSVGVPNFDAYLKTTSHKEQQENYRDALIADMNKVAMARALEKHSNSKKLGPGDRAYDFFSDMESGLAEKFGGEKMNPSDIINAPPTAIKQMEHMVSRFDNPVRPLMEERPIPKVEQVKTANVLEFPRQSETPEVPNATPAQVIQMPPQKLSNESSKIVQDFKQAEDDEDKKTHISAVHGDLSKLEKFSEDQLTQLKDINKSLVRQIDQANEAALAAKRETHDPVADPLAGLLGKKSDPKEKKHGIINALFSGLAEGAELVFGKSVMTGLKNMGKKIFGFKGKDVAELGGNTAKTEESPSLFRRIFGGGKGVSEAAESAKGLSKGAEVAETGGMFAKLGKVLKFGKVLEFGKVIPIIGEVIAAIAAIMDFIPAFINAGAFLGKDKKKITWSDRLAAGVGGMVKGFVGLIDLVIGLFGIKTNVGDILGKGVGKGLSTAFNTFVKFFGMIFKLVKGLMKPIGVLINAIPWDKIGEFFKPLLTMMTTVGKLFDAIGDLADSDKTWKEAFKKIYGIYKNLFADIGKNLLKIGSDAGLANLVFTVMKNMISKVLDSALEYVEKLIGPDTFKGLENTISKIINAIAHPFDTVLSMLTGNGKDHSHIPDLTKKYEPTNTKKKVIDPVTKIPIELHSNTSTTPQSVSVPVGRGTSSGTGSSPVKTAATAPVVSSIPEERSSPSQDTTPKLMMPVKGPIISGFGPRIDPMTKKPNTPHAGIDIAVPVGTPVKATDDGIVVRADGKDVHGFGNAIDILHSNGLISRYGHLSKFLVSKDQKINAGDIIALSGGRKGAVGSGKSEGPHLHFGVYKNTTPLDPRPFLGISGGTNNQNIAVSNNQQSNVPPIQITKRSDNVKRSSPSIGNVAKVIPMKGENAPSIAYTPQKNTQDRTFPVGRGISGSSINFEKLGKEGSKKNISLDFMANAMMTMENPWGGAGKKLNNPGHLAYHPDYEKYYGAKKIPGQRYASFPTWEAGYAALKGQIRWDAQRGMSLRSFVSKFAPKNENDTEKYVKFMTDKLGVSSDAKLGDFLSSSDLSRQVEQQQVADFSKEEKYANKGGQTNNIPPKYSDNNSPVPSESADLLANSANVITGRLHNDVNKMVSTESSNNDDSTSKLEPLKKQKDAPKVLESANVVPVTVTNSTDEKNLRFAKASNESAKNSVLSPVGANAANSNIIAPQSHTHNNQSTNVMANMDANNTEPTYRRTMDAYWYRT